MVYTDTEYETISLRFKTLIYNYDIRGVKDLANVLELKYGCCDCCIMSVPILQSYRKCECVFCFNSIQ